MQVSSRVGSVKSCDAPDWRSLECLFASHCAEAKEMEVIKLKQEAFLGTKSLAVN